MPWNPLRWPAWAQLNGAFLALVAFGGAVVEGQAALTAIEPGIPAHRGYVRDVVLGRQADETVQLAQSEAKSDERFVILEGLLLKQNVTTLDSRLKLLRPQLMALENLLAEKPNSAVLQVQIGDLKDEIKDTEDDLRHARCVLDTRGVPRVAAC